MQYKYGALVSAVKAGSIAEQIGIRPGDIIITCNNTPIHNSNELRNFFANVSLSTKFNLTLIRKNQEINLMTWEYKKNT